MTSSLRSAGSEWAGRRSFAETRGTTFENSEVEGQVQEGSFSVRSHELRSATGEDDEDQVERPRSRSERRNQQRGYPGA